MQLFKSLFPKTLFTQLTVTSSNGFHLRPVAQFVHRAKTFKSHLSVTFKDKTVDAKAVNTLLSLSLETDDTFRLTAKGKDAQKALDTLQTLFNTLMKDDKEIVDIKKESYSYEGTTLEGDIICKGVSIASTSMYETKSVQHKSTLTFKEAVSKTIENLVQKYEAEKNHTNAEIYLAQKELLSSLNEKCETLETLETLISEESANLKETNLSAKISDYLDILQQVKTALGLETKLLFPEDDFILLADDLLPSEIALLSNTKVQGVVLKETSINSHTAILLRASDIPSLIADTSKIPLDKEIILDSFAGLVVLTPSSKDKKKAKAIQEQSKKDKAHSASKRFESAQTTQGKVIKVYANVGDVPSAKVSKEEGAEGIGLLRSEFLFKDVKPTLEIQTRAYTEIFSLFDDVTVRTLDVGGDKALPYINILPENNPFLGIRGIRLFQSHPKILEEQLHAIFVASQDFLGKKIKVMFPMVSTVEEFTQVKSIAQSIANKHQLNISNIAFGIMIEVPSVLFLMDDFNEVVDFYSIGTNDLTQYLFAIERTHASLKVDALSPVVFSAIEMIVRKATKPVSICGELAANSDAIEKLIAIGIQALSVSPKSIAQTKETIRQV